MVLHLAMAIIQILAMEVLEVLAVVAVCKQEQELLAEHLDGLVVVQQTH
jgi:hypothetical protein